MNLLIASLISLLLHAGHQSFFTIGSNDTQILLTVKVDEQDLSNELQGEQIITPSVELSAAEYIGKHFNCSINGIPISFEFESASIRDGYLLLNMTALKPVGKIETIQVENSCFLKHNHAYENQIKIELNSTSVTFKMDSDRTSITHTY